MYKDISYKGMVLFDLVEKFKVELSGGYRIDPDAQKIVSNRSIAWDTPWDHVNPDPKRACSHLQNIFSRLDFIPEFCRNCWKVVVKPRTCVELFKLRDLQRDMNRWCKCGIEVRSWVPGLYGGYFYNDSYYEGVERYHEVRKAVSKAISPDVPVILKRYCTEFEIAKGDSKGYQPPKHSALLEHYYREYFHHEPTNKKQPDFVKAHVYMQWIKFGWKYGTPEDRKEIEDTFNDGEPLYPIPRVYLP